MRLFSTRDLMYCLGSGTSIVRRSSLRVGVLQQKSKLAKPRHLKDAESAENGTKATWARRLKFFSVPNAAAKFRKPFGTPDFNLGDHRLAHQKSLVKIAALTLQRDCQSGPKSTSCRRSLFCRSVSVVRGRVLLLAGTICIRGEFTRGIPGRDALET